MPKHKSKALSRNRRIMDRPKRHSSVGGRIKNKRKLRSKRISNRKKRGKRSHTEGIKSGGIIGWGVWNLYSSLHLNDYKLVRKYVFGDQYWSTWNPACLFAPAPPECAAALRGPGLETIEKNDERVKKLYDDSKKINADLPEVYKLYLVTYKTKLGILPKWLAHIYHSGIFVVPIERGRSSDEFNKEVRGKKVETLLRRAKEAGIPNPDKYLPEDYGEEDVINLILTVEEVKRKNEKATEGGFPDRVLQYGWKDNDGINSGLFSGQSDIYLDPQTVFLGYTSHPICGYLSGHNNQRRFAEVSSLTSNFRRKSNKWAGSAYDLILNNCNHFSIEMILLLRPYIAHDLLNKLTNNDKRFLAFGDIDISWLNPQSTDRYAHLQPPVEEIKKILYELTEQAQTLLKKKDLMQYQLDYGNLKEDVRVSFGEFTELLDYADVWLKRQDLRLSALEIATRYFDIKPDYIKRLLNFRTYGYSSADSTRPNASSGA